MYITPSTFAQSETSFLVLFGEVHGLEAIVARWSFLLKPDPWSLVSEKSKVLLLLKITAQNVLNEEEGESAPYGTFCSSLAPCAHTAKQLCTCNP